jgi:DNA polymerase IV
MSHDQRAKELYFEEQALLDLSDDEKDFPGHDHDLIDRALADSKPMPPPTLERQRSSFLGPTPKERQAAFEAHTSKQRTGKREHGLQLPRSSTAPEAELTNSLPVMGPRGGQLSKSEGGTKLKRVVSLPNLGDVTHTPSYKEVGNIPRELKNGKKVKLANNIKLELEHKQLFKGKVVYFYPNDDISMVRRTRIHKVIQLGAAWVNRWRDDITHIMLDDASNTYSQLLRHLNVAGIPVTISKHYLFHN